MSEKTSQSASKSASKSASSCTSSQSTDSHSASSSASSQSASSQSTDSQHADSQSADSQAFTEQDIEEVLKSDSSGKILSILRDRLAEEMQTITREMAGGVSQKDFESLDAYKASVVAAEQVLMTFWNRQHAH